MNPMNAFKFKSLLERFLVNHPKLSPFFKAAVGTIGEGTVIEVKVISPDNKTIISNIKINEQDMAILNELKELK